MSPEVCAICERDYSDDGESSWDNRHSGFDGEDIHSRCCEDMGPCSQVPFHPYPKGVS